MSYLNIGIIESNARIPGNAVYAKKIIFFVFISNEPVASPS